MSIEDLIECFKDTFEKSNNGGLKRSTIRAAKSNRVYKEGFVSKNKHRNENAFINVYPETTFDIAKRYCSLGKVAVLNFANPERPGGGVQFGAMAQEECLCRSSNLYACLSDHNVFEEYYSYHRSIRNHFYTDRLIYTKNVTVFKDDSIVPKMLPETEWFEVDVITCAAPYLANRKHTNGAVLFELFKSRVKNIFEAARDNNVDFLILGAFGCGAFKNPPLIVADAFRRIIEEQKYLKDFKKIIFAIKPTGECCPNLNTFIRKFDDYAPDAGERTALLDEPLEWRLHRNPTLPAESRFSGNRKYSLWQLENKYFGKQFSVLGDSISTLDGFNPKGYKVFYTGDNCVKSGVVKDTDTWWDKVIGFFGGELLVNNSWSGSRVTKLKDKEQLFPSGCSDERTAALHINNVKPDVILVYLGTNDWAFGAKTGNETRVLDEDNNELFDKAYDNMLKKLKFNYPESEIFCCTLCETYISKSQNFKFPHKYAGTHIEEYSEIIRDVTSRNGCRVIDLYAYKMAYDSIDGSHPTNSGMNTIATMVIREMCDQNDSRFLDCENAEHDYVVNEQYTGGTKYICSKCAKVIHTTTLLPPQEVTMDVKIDLSKYSWGDKKVQEIKKVKISWGDLPLYTIAIEEDSIRLYRKINGSRDGWMKFPDGYFDEINKPLGEEEKRKLFLFLEKIDFSTWKTCETTISNIEQQACGFCVKESFHCEFDDGTAFCCANPPQDQFEEMVDYFKSFFSGEDMEPFHTKDVQAVAFYDDADSRSGYVMLDPDITTTLYSDVLRLTVVNSGYELQFKKKIVEVGRDGNCDLLLEGKTSIARAQATFLFERSMWFLRDNFSTNGTWLNGKRIEPGKKYQLGTNDEINFALTECVVFDKIEHIPMISENHNTLSSCAQSKTNFQTNVAEQTEDRLIGKTIDDKYEVLKLIGRGGYYATYLVKDVHTNKMWAMKTCDKKSRMYGFRMRDMILQEPNMMIKMKHNAIPSVLDIIEDDDSIFIIREYIEGVSLDVILKKSGAQPAEKVVEWGRQLCDMLNYLHTYDPPYVYRDMKPANIILTNDGSLRVIDYGLVQVYVPKGVGDAFCMGTRGYAPPEQYCGQTEPRSDIFSLGMTMHHLVTGISPNEPPYETKPIRQVNSSLPKGLEYIISKCIEPDINMRYQSCNELMCDLNNYLKLPKAKGVFSLLFGKR